MKLELFSHSEEWKLIKGYEDRYEVSNIGRVRSLSLGRRNKYGSIHYGKILKPYLTRYGYYMVDLYYAPNKKKHYLIHRLVAEAFIPNTNNLAQINHKNEIKTDNRVENLEWCDARYNLLYNDRQKKVGKKQRKAIEQLTLQGEHVAFYSSATEAQDILGIWASNISGCCRKKKFHSQAGGYKWRYKNK